MSTGTWDFLFYDIMTCQDINRVQFIFFVKPAPEEEELPVDEEEKEPTEEEPEDIEEGEGGVEQEPTGPTVIDEEQDDEDYNKIGESTGKEGVFGIGEWIDHEEK